MIRLGDALPRTWDYDQTYAHLSFGHDARQTTRQGTVDGACHAAQRRKRNLQWTSFDEEFCHFTPVLPLLFE